MTIWDFVWRALIVGAVLTAGSILGLILWEVLFGIGNWPRRLTGYLEMAPPVAEILRTAQVPVQCSSAA